MSRIRVAFYDPTGKRYGTPTYPWCMVPEGLATRRQLAAAGLRPGGQPIAAQILWHSHRYRPPGGIRVAYLYDTAHARPKRKPTPAQQAALARAMSARRTCPRCGLDVGYIPPRRLGCCFDCATTWEQEHTT